MNLPPRLLAFLMTLGFFTLIWLYMREFPLLSNTIGAGALAAGSLIAGLGISAALVWRFRKRFMPWERHRPDVAFVIVSALFFAPLLGSWLNRAFGNTTFQTFRFVSETPFVSSGYGILKNETIKPSGYHLVVEENGELRRFKYKSQAYYPVTKQGEEILLPVRKGFFGARVMLLK